MRILLLAAFALLLFGCDDPEENHSGVYIVGQQSDSEYDFVSMVIWKNGKIKYTTEANTVVWKNGMEENVCDGLEPSEGAFSLLISGTDIWVSGYVTDSNFRTVATIWKNAVAAAVGEEMPGFALSIDQKGNDILVAGSKEIDAFYAVNGEVSILPKRNEIASAHHLVVVP